MELVPPFYELEGQIAVDLPGARAVFTTAAAGDVRETLPALAKLFGVHAVRPLQVHSKVVLDLDAALTHALPAIPVPGTATVVDVEADAVCNARRGVAPTVITADCLPIAIAGGGVVAVVHAGWRGLDVGIIDATVRTIRRHAQDAELAAAIGPAAGPDSYEVGPELHERFAGYSNGANLDLPAIARDQLHAVGVKTVYDCGICTISSEDPELFSYRRQGPQAGRQALLAWLV